MAKVGKYIAGGALVLAGIGIGVLSGNWTLGLAIAAQGVGLIYQQVRTRAISERQGAILENRADVKAGLPVVYGTAKIGGILSDWREDPASANKKRLVVVVGLAHGSQDGTGIEAITRIDLNDEVAWTSVGGVALIKYGTPIDTPADPYQLNKHLRVINHLGVAAPTVDSILTAIFPSEWPSTSKGGGVAYTILLMWFDTAVFGTGLPRVNATVNGQKIYDPRHGVTAFSTNSALVVRDYLTSPIYGFGIPDAEIDDVSFEAEADYCDELVDTFSGGTPQKRFETNGVLDVARPLNSNLNELLSACRGNVLNVGDKWRLIIRKEQAASGLKVTPHNTIEGSWRYVLPGSSDAYNKLVANYVDPTRDYRVDAVAWPDPDGSNPYLTADQGYENSAAVDLPFTTDRLRAQQIAMVVLRESRESIAVTLTGKEELLRAEYGDIVEVTNPSPGWVDKPFWVVGTNYSPASGTIELILVEYESTAYTLDEQFPQPATPDTGLPDPTIIDPPTSLVLTAGDAESIVTADGVRIARIKMEWDRPVDPFLSHYDIQAKKTIDTDYDSYGPANKDDELFFISPVTSDSWDVRIRAVNSLGVNSDWVTDTITPTLSTAVPSIEIADSPVARLRFRETDETLPDGLWGITLDGDHLKIQKNTAAGGDFSTLIDVLEMTEDGLINVIVGTPFRVNYNSTNYLGITVSSAGVVTLQAHGSAPSFVVDNAVLFVGAVEIDNPLTITTPANSHALNITGSTNTGANTTVLVAVDHTWNTSGVVTLIDVNLTVSAAGTGSKIINLRSGSNPIFLAGINGDVLLGRCDSATAFATITRATDGAQVWTVSGTDPEFQVFVGSDQALAFLHNGGTPFGVLGGGPWSVNDALDVQGNVTIGLGFQVNVRTGTVSDPAIVDLDGAFGAGVFFDNADDALAVAWNATEMARFRANGSDEMGIMLYDQSASSLKQVFRGASNSGGSGKRLLCVNN